MIQSVANIYANVHWSRSKHSGGPKKKKMESGNSVSNFLGSPLREFTEQRPITKQCSPNDENGKRDTRDHMCVHLACRTRHVDEKCISWHAEALVSTTERISRVNDAPSGVSTNESFLRRWKRKAIDGESGVYVCARESEKDEAKRGRNMKEQGKQRESVDYP